MNRTFNRIVSLVLLAVLLVGCSPAAPEATQPPAAESPPPPKAVTVRIGTQPWIGYGPWWIAKEKGLFEKYNLDVELIDFVQDQDVNAALASGRMEAANLASHTAIKLFSAGLDIRIVLMEDASYAADAILAGSEVEDIRGLKGMQVAYEEGATSDLLLNYALMENGMSIDDIQKVPMPAADAGVALISGRVQVAVTYEPYISEALAQNEDIRLLYEATERPGLISDVLVVTTSFMQEQPQAVRDLLKVWDEAMAFYNSNPDKAKAIIARNVGSKPEELASAFDGVRFYALADNQAELDKAFLDTLMDVAEVSLAIGLIDEIPALDKLVDASFVR